MEGSGSQISPEKQVNGTWADWLWGGRQQVRGRELLCSRCIVMICTLPNLLFIFPRRQYWERERMLPLIGKTWVQIPRLLLSSFLTSVICFFLYPSLSFLLKKMKITILTL